MLHYATHNAFPFFPSNSNTEYQTVCFPQMHFTSLIASIRGSDSLLCLVLSCAVSPLAALFFSHVVFKVILLQIIQNMRY